MAPRPDNSAGKLPRRTFAKEPVHAQVIGLCREAIFSGKFVSGERFPSERELSQLYEVSRTTANKVVTALIGEGLLDLQKGIGTRVCKRRSLFASLDGMAERTITTSAFSKTFAVTGWRLGYCIAPPEITGAIRKMPAKS